MTTDACPFRRASLFSLWFVVACNGTSSYLDATGKTGRAEARLGVWLVTIASIVVAGVCIAIAAGIVRHRSRDQTDVGIERQRIASGLNWIYIGTGSTFVVLCAVFVGTMVTLTAATHPSPTPSLTLDVTGHQWWWEVTYSDPSNASLGFTTANEIHLPIGMPVRVKLHSADVIHSFWLPQIAGKMDAIPGQVNETWVEAERQGVTRGMCAEYCGLEHAEMALTVTAERPDQFNSWAQSRRAEALAPQGDAAKVGQNIFVSSCGACHAVGGTPALGHTAPELTHFAARPTIGAGALENTPANLERWIHDAPAVKEGSRMPPMPLNAAELRAVVAYLETLR